MFNIKNLEYSNVALDPYIDEETMILHHDKHHAAYVDNLNKALEVHPEFKVESLWHLLSDLDSVPEDIRTKVRNHGGGHANHSFFWDLLSPEFDQSPSESVLSAINSSFGDLESFKKQFTEAAIGRFGSGWAWLVVDSESKLSITSTPNQDTPWMEKKDAIIGLDVWEHAYYLKYQNRRAEYIEAFWHVLNWKQVEINYQKALSYLK